MHQLRVSWHVKLTLEALNTVSGTVIHGLYLNEFSSFKAMGNLLGCHVGFKHLFL